MMMVESSCLNKTSCGLPITSLTSTLIRATN